jgi:hypothetical protein
MPILEAFALEALAPEAATLGAEALAPELLGTAALTSELAGLSGIPGALGGAELGGITQAQMAADAAAGGAGAGGAGVNAAQIAAQQNAATQLANPGITGVPQAPMGLEMPGAYTPPANYPMGINAQIPAEQFIEAGSGVPYTAENAMAQANLTANATPPSALEAGMDKAIKFAEKNPFTAMTAAYMGANALGLLNPSGATFNNAPYSGPLSKYFLSPNFQGRNVNPADYQYTPKRYVEGGGIMGAMPQMGNNISVGYDEGGMADNTPSYASGGSLSDSITQYQRMLSGNTPAAPAPSHDVGIYYDLDPDTRYQDPLTAAQIRQAKVNQRAYVSAPVAKRPTPMGKLNLPTSSKSKDSSGGDVEAYRGGIMHSSLGGYAAGGNPRLLKGPGDGMSDNIPATINGRQPARLADGEFVIPADVVSHLGNGSTEAGAKQLHGMMDKVRKARTGNPKQGKEINPQKYMPK